MSDDGNKGEAGQKWGLCCVWVNMERWWNYEEDGKWKIRVRWGIYTRSESYRFVKVLKGNSWHRTKGVNRSLLTPNLSLSHWGLFGLTLGVLLNSVRSCWSLIKSFFLTHFWCKYTTSGICELLPMCACARWMIAFLSTNSLLMVILCIWKRLFSCSVSFQWLNQKL